MLQIVITPMNVSPLTGGSGRRGQETQQLLLPTDLVSFLMKKSMAAFRAARSGHTPYSFPKLLVTVHGDPLPDVIV